MRFSTERQRCPKENVKMQRTKKNGKQKKFFVASNEKKKNATKSRKAN